MASSLLTVSLLLALPIAALIRTGNPQATTLALAGYALMSGITLLCYRHDKKAAQQNRWRTPEATLHLLALAGGWPGAFLGQRILRHKGRKLSFLLPFWAVVSLHQLVALDSLIGWKLSRQAMEFLRIPFTKT